MHCSSDTLWSTHTYWVKSNYTLRSASLLPHFPSRRAFHPQAVKFQQRNAIEPVRAGQEVKKSWSNQTSSVCLILLVKDPGWLVEVWRVVVPIMLTFVVKRSKTVTDPPTLVCTHCLFLHSYSELQRHTYTWLELKICTLVIFQRCKWGIWLLSHRISVQYWQFLNVSLSNSAFSYLY